tara:strand:+ start:18 stop:683 length:666 start_codon:yes stop_codon:yes gene_type:complete
LKYAVIGKGKTGSHVIDLLKESNASYGVFDSKNTITLERLKNYDAGICFVNGPIFKSLIPVFIDSQIPLVIGTTGFQWEESLFMDVKKRKCRWIKSANFSIGINTLNDVLYNNFTRLKSIYPEYKLLIHEEHHDKKLDAPSGTALRFAEILGDRIEITHERKNDIKGFHSVSINTKDEKVTITHEVKNRAVFANGAIQATQLLVDLDFGIHEFGTLLHQDV